MTFRTLILKTRLRQDVEVLSGAYSSAVKGLEVRSQEIEDSARIRVGIGPDDQWPDRDDTTLDHDNVGAAYDDAADLEEVNDQGRPLLRIAFAIALFHLWEKHCNAMIGNKEDYTTLATSQIKISPEHAASANVLVELKGVANCAKHGPGPSSRALFKRHQHLFPHVDDQSKASHKSLRISDADLERYFQAVKAATKHGFEAKPV